MKRVLYILILHFFIGSSGNLAAAQKGNNAVVEQSLRTLKKTLKTLTTNLTHKPNGSKNRKINHADFEDNEFEFEPTSETVNVNLEELFGNLQFGGRDELLEPTTTDCDTWAFVIRKLKQECQRTLKGVDYLIGTIEHDITTVDNKKIEAEKYFWIEKIIQKTNEKPLALQEAYKQLLTNITIFSGKSDEKAVTVYTELKERIRKDDFSSENERSKALKAAHILFKKFERSPFFRPLFIADIKIPELVQTLHAGLAKIKERESNKKRKRQCDLYARAATLKLDEELKKFSTTLINFHSKRAEAVNKLFEALNKALDTIRTKTSSVDEKIIQAEQLLEKVEEEIERALRHLEKGAQKLTLDNMALEEKLVAESKNIPYGMWRKFFSSVNAYSELIQPTLKIQLDTTLFATELLTLIILFEIKAYALALAYAAGMGKGKINELTTTFLTPKDVARKDRITYLFHFQRKGTEQSAATITAATKILTTGQKDGMTRKLMPGVSVIKFPEVESLVQLSRDIIQEAKTSVRKLAQASSIHQVLAPEFIGFKVKASHDSTEQTESPRKPKPEQEKWPKKVRFEDETEADLNELD